MFSDNFFWGAATSSYQIEGAYDADGKGLGIYDVFTHRKGKIFRNQSGDIAADHYYRFKEDVDLMKQIGLQAYRFSLSWPRIFPEGTGTINLKGIDFYNRLIDSLLKKNIEPFLTLYHFDYPYPLQLRGGWLNPDSPKWFAEFALKVAESFSDRVKNWFTYNEPQCVIRAHLGWEIAPDLAYSMKEALQAGHNSLLGHGLAVKAIHAVAKQKPNIGYAPIACTFTPATDNTADIEAARKASFSIPVSEPLFNSVWWMDPVYKGEYPQAGLDFFKKDIPEIKPGDMELISQPLDFFGMNIYTSQGKVRAAETDTGYEIVDWPKGNQQSMFHWNIEPRAMYYALKFLYERYKLPIVIAENGLSNPDWICADGKIHDAQRIDYLGKHLQLLEKAVDEGIPVLGYFHWSLMDNFEWAHGYKQRFGLIHVDFETQKRTLKQSAYWYQKLIASNGGILTETDKWFE